MCSNGCLASLVFKVSSREELGTKKASYYTNYHLFRFLYHQKTQCFEIDFNEKKRLGGALFISLALTRILKESLLASFLVGFVGSSGYLF